MEPAGKAHAFVDDLDALTLAGHDRHHLERVLRLRDGDELTVSDGAGRWRVCRFGRDLEPLGPIEVDPAPRPAITVGFALVKSDRNDWIVQKLTELGVDRIAPFVADRSIVRWDAERAVRQLERFDSIAREAAMQSRRAFLPVVEGVGSFDEIAQRAGAVLADRGGAPPSLEHPVVLIGPEGGWSETESSVPNPRMTLGPTVLRSETAAIAAAATLSGLRSALFEAKHGHSG